MGNSVVGMHIVQLDLPSSHNPGMNSSVYSPLFHPEYLYLEPGPVIGVEGHCSVVVWKEPDEPNGLILNYTILFYLNGGNDSGVLIETADDKTSFVIESKYQLPLIPEGLALFIKVNMILLIYSVVCVHIMLLCIHECVMCMCVS